MNNNFKYKEIKYNNIQEGSSLMNKWEPREDPKILVERTSTKIYIHKKNLTFLLRNKEELYDNKYYTLEVNKKEMGNTLKVMRHFTEKNDERKEIYRSYNKFIKRKIIINITSTGNNTFFTAGFVREIPNKNLLKFFDPENKYSSSSQNYVTLPKFSDLRSEEIETIKSRMEANEMNREEIDNTFKKWEEEEEERAFKEEQREHKRGIRKNIRISSVGKEDEEKDKAQKEAAKKEKERKEKERMEKAKTLGQEYIEEPSEEKKIRKNKKSTRSLPILTQNAAFAFGKSLLKSIDLTRSTFIFKLRGTALGKRHALQGLQSAFALYKKAIIERIENNTPVPHGGCRNKKRKRL